MLEDLPTLRGPALTLVHALDDLVRAPRHPAAVAVGVVVVVVAVAPRHLPVSHHHHHDDDDSLLYPSHTHYPLQLLNANPTLNSTTTVVLVMYVSSVSVVRIDGVRYKWASDDGGAV